MFSTGQLIFALLFIIIFAGAISFSYIKDKKLHQKNFQGVKWVGIFFTIFIIMLFVIKFLTKN